MFKGTSGVGKETLQYLLPHGPSHIIITGRNQSAAERLIAESKASNPTVQVTFVSCELDSLEAVKLASSSILSKIDRLDLVFCGAGIMCNPPAISKDGYELQFATNHLGHALLIKELLPILQRTVKESKSDVRVVITSSQAAALLLPAGGIQFELLKTTQSMFFGTWRRYGQSKLANILYARALAKQYPSILFTSVHPGVSFTGLGRSMGWFDTLFVHIFTIGMTQPAHELAWNGLWAATGDRNGVENGAYYEPVGIKPSLKDYRGDEKLEERLWEWTERELEKWM